MLRSTLDFLLDIQKETQLLMEHTSNKDYKQFITDDILLRATERSLEIIGESVKNIPEEFRIRHPLIDWKGITGMRDKLIHHYFGVDYEIVWSVIKEEIPLLLETVEAIIAHEKNNKIT
ncbi:MAG: DUF86 domain-containing protein [Bacteroidetes bacterium]|nr:DUF86 domain-containing protein [Bacteroidota bacterium]